MANRWLFLILFVLVQSCKKERVSSNEPTAPNNPTVVSLKRHLVDSTQSKLISTPLEIANGLFKYDKLPGIDSISKGDFLIESRNFGYLRKVEDIVISESQVSLSTIQGTMDELYSDSGTISNPILVPSDKNPFLLRANKANKVASGAPAEISVFNNTNFNVAPFTLDGDGWKIKFNKMNYLFQPNAVFEFNVKAKYLKMGFVDAQTHIDFDADWEVQLDKLEVSDTNSLNRRIPNFSKFNRIPWVFLGIPIGYIEVDLIAVISISGTIKASANYQYSNDAKTTAFVEYKDNAFNYQVGEDAQKPIEKLTTSAAGQVSLKITIYPEFKFHFFSLPLVSFGITNTYEHSLDYNLGKGIWNIEAYYQLGMFGKTESSVFSFLPVKKFSTGLPKKVLYESPKKIIIVSGATETGLQGDPLKEPIVVQVVDKNLNPESPVKVFYSSSNGTWENQIVETTIFTGLASNKYTMGIGNLPNVLTIEIKNGKDLTIDKQILTIIPKKLGKELPVVTTIRITASTQTTAIGGGNVLDSGSSAVTQRGVCWSLTPSPSISNSKTNDGTGLGSFVSSLSKLTPKTYYLRAYAINDAGVGYGNEITFLPIPDVQNTIFNGFFTWDSVATIGTRFVKQDGAQYPLSLSLFMNNSPVYGTMTTGSETNYISGALTGLIAEYNNGGGGPSSSPYLITRKWEFAGTLAGSKYSGTYTLTSHFAGGTGSILRGRFELTK